MSELVNSLGVGLSLISIVELNGFNSCRENDLSVSLLLSSELMSEFGLPALEVLAGGNALLGQEKSGDGSHNKGDNLPRFHIWWD